MIEGSAGEPESSFGASGKLGDAPGIAAGDWASSLVSCWEGLWGFGRKVRSSLGMDSSGSVSGGRRWILLEIGEILKRKLFCQWFGNLEVSGSETLDTQMVWKPWFWDSIEWFGDLWIIRMVRRPWIIRWFGDLMFRRFGDLGFR